MNDQDRANQFLERLQNKAVPRKASRQQKIADRLFQQKRKYHLNYHSPEHLYPNRRPTRLERLQTLAFNEWARSHNSDGPAATRRPHRYLAHIAPREIVGEEIQLHDKNRTELERQGTSRGVEWLRQIRGIPAPKKQPRKV